LVIIELKEMLEISKSKDIINRLKFEMEERKYLKNRLDKLISNIDKKTTMVVKGSIYGRISEEVSFDDQDNVFDLKEHFLSSNGSHFKYVDETILIYGIPKFGRNSQDIYLNDLKYVNELLEKIGLSRDQVFKQRRMKIKRDIILVIFKFKEYRAKALQNKLLLKNDPKFETVYINKYLERDVLDLFFNARRKVKYLNSLLDNFDEKGRAYGIENGQKFHWAVRHSKPVKIFITNSSLSFLK
jgi:hypothetical protein